MNGDSNMKRVMAFLKNINFYQLIVYFFLSLSVLSLGSCLGCAFKVSTSEYYSRVISSNKKTSVLVQDCKGVNFLNNNNFYVGYEFNYYFTTNYIKTLFHSTYGSTQFYFFSSNTGMTSEKYLAPNICDLSVTDGHAFSKAWNSSECYVNKTFFANAFPGDEFDFQTISVEGFDFKIVGIVDDKSIGALDSIYGKDKIYVSYEFATKELYNNYNLLSIFTKRDFVGNKRYLDYYFARYLTNSTYHNDINFLQNNGNDVIKVREIQKNNIPLMPLTFIVVSTVVFIFTIKNKKAFISSQIKAFDYMPFFFFVLGLIIIWVILSDFLFRLFTFVVTSKIIIVSFVVCSCFAAAISILKKRTNSTMLLSDNYYKMDI